MKKYSKYTLYKYEEDIIYNKYDFDLHKIKQHFEKLHEEVKVKYLKWLDKEIKENKIDITMHYDTKKGSKEADDVYARIYKENPNKIFTYEEIIAATNLKDSEGSIIIKDVTHEELEKYVKKELEFWREQVTRSSGEVAQYSFSKITWLKNKQDLTKIFDLLAGLGYIAFDKNKDTILRQHFTWVDGEISASSLKSNRNNAKNKKETYKTSDEYKKLLESMKEKLENEIKEINGS